MTRLVFILLATAAFAPCGCALFSPAYDSLLQKPGASPLQFDEIAEFEGRSPVQVKHVVRFDSAIMSAASSDRRLRTLIWEELDESGPMSPQDRRRLNESGLRIGVAGTTLPWALQNLMKDQNHSQQGASTFSIGSNVTLLEGNHAMIELPQMNDSLMLPRDRLAGLKAGGELKDARCIFDMQVLEHGDGWVVVRFLPQILHGTRTHRYTVTDTGAQLPVRQNIQPLYEQQFELKLHLNETIVIGHLETEEWSIGRMMFQTEELSSRSERLIALRLTNMEAVQGQSAMTVDVRTQ